MLFCFSLSYILGNVANYVVLQLQVTHVDSIALAEASAGIESKDEDEESRCFICLKWLRGLMGVRAQRKLESDVCKYFIATASSVVFVFHRSS